MASPKNEQQNVPYVVVITNSTLTQVVCGPFKSAKAAERYAKKLNRVPMAAFEAVASPITPTKVVNEFLKLGHQ